MNPKRNGKIARLPRSVRDQLNARIEDGAEGKALVVWLNSLPEVQALIAGEFCGVQISEQNLSRWRAGGYQDWQARRETRELAEQFLGEAAAAAGDENAPPLTETLAQWVAAHYAVSSRRLVKAEGAEQWRLLREMCTDVVRLRRSDQNAERFDLQRERMALASQLAKARARLRLMTLPAENPGPPGHAE